MADRALFTAGELQPRPNLRSRYQLQILQLFLDLPINRTVGLLQVFMHALRALPRNTMITQALESSVQVLKMILKSSHEEDAFSSIPKSAG